MKYVCSSLVVVLVSLIVWDIFFRDIPVSTVVDYEYKTDTIYVNVPYEVPKPYEVYTPPITLTEYIVDSSLIDSLSILLDQKDLVILGLKDSLRINENYIKQFPSNPKLVFMDLRRDTLSLALLSISGQIKENNWPIDLNAFDYRWNYSSDLSRHPTQSPPTLEKPFAEYFVGGGVDLLWRSPYIRTSVEKDLARIRLYGDLQIGLLKKESSQISLGLDYRLNGKNRN